MDETTTIGRDPDRELQLLDRSEDRLHATIAGCRGVFLLTPHGPVGLAGHPLGTVAPIALCDGDVITLGAHTLVFQLAQILPHGVVPGHLTMLPLGIAMPIVRVEHALAPHKVEACVQAAIATGPAMVISRGAASTELLFEAAGPALATALTLVRTLGALAGPGGGLRLGADLAPLDAARTGAAHASAGSSGHLVATDSFIGRALHEARLAALAGELVVTRIVDDPAATDVVRFRIEA